MTSSRTTAKDGCVYPLWFSPSHRCRDPLHHHRARVTSCCLCHVQVQTLLLLSAPFTLMTVPNLMIPILNSYTLDAVENPRLQRLKEKVSPYIFTAQWRLGKYLCIPDALSKGSIFHPTPEDETDCQMAAVLICLIVTCNTITVDESTPPMDTGRTLQKLHATSREDPVFGWLSSCVSSGFPTNCYNLHPSVLPYGKLWDNLYADGELVLYGQRIVVPTAFCRRTLTRLHDNPRGIEATKEPVFASLRR